VALVRPGPPGTPTAERLIAEGGGGRTAYAEAGPSPELTTCSPQGTEAGFARWIALRPPTQVLGGLPTGWHCEPLV
jgi:hypothetical protein